MKPIGQAALEEAQRYIGVKECPAGSNDTVFGRWLGVNKAPWCAAFVSFCFNVAAGYIIGAGYKTAGMHPRGGAYVPTIEAWLKESGQWIERSDPQPGDIAIFNWDKAGVPEHIGIVEKSLGGGAFVCIEGNTAVGNDSNGGEVMRRTRRIGQVDGFGRIK